MKVRVVSVPAEGKPIDLDAWAAKFVRAVIQLEERGSRAVVSDETSTRPGAA